MNSFNDSLPILARMLANDHKVKIVYGMQDTKCEDSTIFLPTLKVGLQSTENIALGYIVRESSRIRNFGNFQISSKGSLCNVLTGILFEILVEKIAIDQFSGARKTLNSLIESMIHLNQIHASNRDDIADVFLSFITAYLRLTVLKQLCIQQVYMCEARSINSHFRVSLVANLLEILDSFKSARTHDHCSSIAKRLVQLLQTTKSDPQKSSNEKPSMDEDNGEDQNGSDSNDSEQQTNQSKVENDGIQTLTDDDSVNVEGAASASDENQATPMEDASSNDELSDSNDSTVQQSQSDSESLSDEMSESAMPGVSDPSGEDQSSAINVLLDSEIVTQPVSQLAENILNSERVRNREDLKSTLTISNEVPIKLIVDGAGILEETKFSTSALRFKLEQLLETQTRKQRYFAKSGKIVPSRVWRLKCGNPRVFENTSDNKKIDTSILFIVDGSGSMGNLVGTAFSGCSPSTRLSLALQSVLALSMSVGDIKGISTAAAAFPFRDKLTGFENGVGVMLDFDNRASAAASKFSSVVAKGNTPLAEVVMWGIYKLLSHKSKRKILYIATDGQPSNVPLAQQALQKAQDAGIEVIGLGLGISISNLIIDSGRIDSIEEMPKQVFNVLSKKLLDQFH